MLFILYLFIVETKLTSFPITEVIWVWLYVKPTKKHSWIRALTVTLWLHRFFPVTRDSFSVISRCHGELEETNENALWRKKYKLKVRLSYLLSQQGHKLIYTWSVKPQTNIIQFLKKIIEHSKDFSVSDYINTSEVLGELSRKNLISSHVKITCYLHMWKYHCCYGYIINPAFHTKKMFKWNGLVFHRCFMI